MIKLLRSLIACVLTFLIGVSPVYSSDDPLMAVVVNGSNAYTPDKLLPSYEIFLGQPLNDITHQRIRDNLRSLYLSDGFHPPQVKTEAEKDQAGILVVSINEARVESIRLSGSKQVDPQRVREHLIRLKNLQPISEQAFSDWIEQTRQSTGLYIEGELLPRRSEPYLFDASLVMQPRRWTVRLGVNNEGTDQVGREMLNGQLSILGIGPTDLEAHLRLVTAVEAEELQYLSFQAVQGLGLSEMYFGGSSSVVELEDSNTLLDRSYERDKAWLGMRHELLRNQRFLLSAGMSFTASDYLREVDTLPDQEQNLRKLSANGSLFYRPSNNQMHRLWLRLTKGLDTLGAEINPESDLVTPEYLMYSLDYRYEYALKKWGDLEYELSLQLADDTLPLEDRFRVGGVGLVGALEPSTISGDEGASSRLTWYSQEFASGKTMRFYSYLDYGRAWREEGRRQGLYASSAAAGLRFQNNLFKAYAEVASLIQASDALTEVDSGDTRATFSLEFIF